MRKFMFLFALLTACGGGDGSSTDDPGVVKQYIQLSGSEPAQGDVVSHTQTIIKLYFPSIIKDSIIQVALCEEGADSCTPLSLNASDTVASGRTPTLTPGRTYSVVYDYTSYKGVSLPNITDTYGTPLLKFSFSFTVKPWTVLRGAITQDTTYPASGSPYLFEELSSYAKLTFEAGVEAHGIVKLKESGSISALGTSSSPVIFRNGGIVSDWGESGTFVELDYVVMDMFVPSIYGTGLISHSEVRAGCRAGSPTPRGFLVNSGSIADSKIADCRLSAGFQSLAFDRNVVSNTEIDMNSETFTSISNNHFTDSRLHLNGCSNRATVKGNSFKSMKLNSIDVMSCAAPSETWDWSQNYWYTQDVMAVEALFDYSDSPENWNVQVSPILTTAALGTPLP